MKEKLKWHGLFIVLLLTWCGMRGKWFVCQSMPFLFFKPIEFWNEPAEDFRQRKHDEDFQRVPMMIFVFYPSKRNGSMGRIGYKVEVTIGHPLPEGQVLHQMTNLHHKSFVSFSWFRFCRWRWCCLKRTNQPIVMVRVQYKVEEVLHLLGPIVGRAGRFSW